MKYPEPVPPVTFVPVASPFTPESTGFPTSSTLFPAASVDVGVSSGGPATRNIVPETSMRVISIKPWMSIGSDRCALKSASL